nr:folate-binding Fe/S cluster repair protein [uncultured Psychrobacter sp.]
MTDSHLPLFSQITIEGEDAEKFLQGQITIDVTKLGLSYQPTALSNLKGRIEFGLWIKKQDEKQYDVVISTDCVDALLAHLNKFGAFSKFTTSAPVTIYPCVLDHEPTFSHSSDNADGQQWAAISIATGNYWIVAKTQGEFQPQELRLHQRGGMDYDKGCYLGQEVIARIYFKAAPKAFLHRVKGSGETPLAGEKLGKIQVVNAISTDTGFEALVVARPEALGDSEMRVLDLPEALQADVARPQ